MKKNKTKKIIKENKILEISLFIDPYEKNCTKYFTMNYPEEIYFEGSKDLTPLTEAKNWAKQKGYKHLEIVSFELKTQNKIYEL